MRFSSALPSDTPGCVLSAGRLSTRAISAPRILLSADTVGEVRRVVPDDEQRPTLRDDVGGAVRIAVVRVAAGRPPRPPHDELDPIFDTRIGGKLRCAVQPERRLPQRPHSHLVAFPGAAPTPRWPAQLRRTLDALHQDPGQREQPRQLTLPSARRYLTLDSGRPNWIRIDQGGCFETSRPTTIPTSPTWRRGSCTTAWQTCLVRPPAPRLWR